MTSLGVHGDALDALARRFGLERRLCQVVGPRHPNDRDEDESDASLQERVFIEMGRHDFTDEDADLWAQLEDLICKRGEL